MSGTGQRPRWLLHASTAAVAAIVTAAVVFGVASLRDPEPGGRPAGPAPASAGTPPRAAASSANAGPLTVLPDLCTLVPSATFAELSLESTASASGRERRASDGAGTAFCEWTGGRTIAGDAPDRRSLRVFAILHRTRQEATDMMEFERGVVRNLSGTATRDPAADLDLTYGPYREVPGIGGEAFAQNTVQSDWCTTRVLARHENITLEIVHGAAVRPGEDERAVPSVDAAAERVTRRVVGALPG